MHMAGYFSMRMKRKDLEEVNEEFSDFSLCSPARKIRRLDAELPPIMEEEEQEITQVFGQSMPQEQFISILEQRGGPIIEELPSDPVNEERAIVLFKHMNAPFLQSPQSYSVSVSPDIISGFKNQVLWSSQSNPVKSAEDEAATREKSRGSTNKCLAVVPWVPSQLPPKPAAAPEMMEAEEMEATKMDIEDDNVGVEPGQTNEFDGMSGAGGLNHWQQQHCLIPQIPQNASTPVVWFR
ncbi:hypothetical protein F0562_030715 [Nyssa sinensis]|uniref:Uncharacterized protein n=1 Tax=Nyssa sinensis TaxID=561372 RepID=A0A5J5B1F7_9ASTE|nr:hypothetical protein F0562_030715 [Nyssa sinensis]